MTIDAFTHITLITLCFFVFFSVTSIFFLKKINRPMLFVVFLGIVQGISYLLLVKGTSLPFWGLIGDEIFVTALYEKVAHAGLFVDFAYSSLPPFYPPLFFWVFGSFGKWFDLNGVQIAKLAIASVFTVFPLLWYLFSPKRSVLFRGYSRWVWAIAAMLLFVFVPSDVIIMKPYEFTSAAFMVLWVVFLVSFLQEKKYRWLGVVLLGITGGILFLWFYFWLFFAAIAVMLYFVLSKQSLSLKQYALLGVISAIILLVASPYLFPLVTSYLAYGAENWQVGFTYSGRIAIHGPLVDWSVRSLLSLIAVAIMLRYRQQPGMRLLACLWLTPVIWQLLGLITISIFQSPLQESKGFFDVHGAVYAIVLAWGIEKLFASISHHERLAPWGTPAAIVGIWILSLQLIFGTFHQDPTVIAVKDRAVVSQQSQELVRVINERPSVRTLHSGIMELHAFTPLDSFIYFNMHASHPAARFSERVRILDACALLGESEALARCFHDTPYGAIERLVFFRDAERDFYHVVVHVDNYPNGIMERVIRFPKGLFESPYFDTVYKNDRYIVFEPRGL